MIIILRQRFCTIPLQGLITVSLCKTPTSQVFNLHCTTQLEEITRRVYTFN